MVSGMQRIVLWFLSTVTVGVLLFGYHTSTEGRAGSVQASAIAPVRPSASSGASGSASGTSASATTTTVDGDEEQTQWGSVQVELTITDGKITDVQVPTYPNGNGRDAEINAYALPRLVQETLEAQSAQIDMVTGATVTSDGYVRSLQSALDKANL